MKTFEEKTLNSTKLYAGRIIALRRDEVKLPNGKTAKREVVEHPGAVAIIAVTDKDEIVLIKQFRKPVEEIIYEIPAGLAKKAEALPAAARRELKEETGYRAGHIEKIVSAYASPGYSSEVIHFFLAKNLRLTKQSLDEDEVVKVEVLNIKAAQAKIKTGEIKDSKTIVGIMVAARKL